MSSPNTMPQDPVAHPYLPRFIFLIATRIISIFSISLSLLGVYGRVLHIRCLLPRHIIQSLSALLDETQHLLDRAEAIGAIPPESVHRTQLYWYDFFFLCIWWSVSSCAHTLTQFCEPIYHDAHQEQSCSRDFPAVAPWCSPDLQTLCSLLSN